MASPRTRKPGARLRRKEGGDVGAVLQQLGNPVARPLVPKAASQPFGARSREQRLRVLQNGDGWRCRLKVRCPSAAPKDWRNAWNQADPVVGLRPTSKTVPLRGTSRIGVPRLATLANSRIGWRCRPARCARLAAIATAHHPPPPPNRYANFGYVDLAAMQRCRSDRHGAGGFPRDHPRAPGPTSRRDSAVAYPCSGLRCHGAIADRCSFGLGRSHRHTADWLTRSRCEPPPLYSPTGLGRITD